jgi:hypothetical protein
MLQSSRMSESPFPKLSETDFPASGSPAQRLNFALQYAALAPKENGWQPWHVRMSDQYLELMLKNKPALAATDPDRRGPIIGTGAALLYLKQALKHFGCLGRVTAFPDLGEPDLVARVHYGSSNERDARGKNLFHAMTGTPESALGATPLNLPMLNALGQATASERSWLDFTQSESSRRYVMKVSLGIAEDQPEPPAEGLHSRWRLPFLAPRGQRGNSLNVSFTPDDSPVSAATLAVVKTKTDDKHGWLEAGKTMARTILHAQALGLSWSFFDPMHRPEARAALRTGVGHKGFAQVILRFDPLTESDTTVVSLDALPMLTHVH